MGQKLRNSLAQVVHTYVQYNVITGQGAVMLCGWAGNHWPGGK